MIRVRHSRSEAPRGFSLVEMLVALALGLLLSIGIISLFVSTSRSNKAQAQLARLQESGRFAMSRIVDDLQLANAQYCSNTGGISQIASGGYAYQDGLRAPLIYATAFKLPDNNAAIPPMAGNAYPMVSRLFMRGYECDDKNCKPSVPNGVSGMPAMGINADDRAKRADVLTVRYLSGNGWSAFENGSQQVCNSTGELTSLTIVPKTSTPAKPSDDLPLSHFQDGDLALLADCSAAEVFAVKKAGSVFTPDKTGNVASDAPRCVSASSDARLFDFTRDYLTVSY